MNLHTWESILSLDVMGAVHAAAEGVGPMKYGGCICVYTIVFDQNALRSCVIFRLQLKPTGC